MLNIKDIIGRIEGVIQSTRNIDLAREMGVATGVSSNWKTRNTIPFPELFEFAQKHKISMDWLLSGESCGHEGCPAECDDELIQLCIKVKRVIQSRTAFGKALEANIHAFDESVTLKREVENLKKVMLPGQSAGMTNGPVGSTGKKRKAGSRG